jgi:hypothetical protein
MPRTSEFMPTTLEIELDLELTDEQISSFNAYRERGMDEITAWRQVAQDAFGHTGAIVQGATAVPT